MQSLLIRYGITALLGSSLLAFLYFTYAIVPKSTLKGLEANIRTLETKLTTKTNIITNLQNSNRRSLTECTHSYNQDLVNNTLRRIHEVPVKVPEVNSTTPITYYY